MCNKSIKGYFVPILILVSASFISDILCFICLKSSINILVIYRFYTLVEFILISFFYYLFFKKYFKSGYLLLVIPVFLFIAFSDYKINGLMNMDNLSTSVESVLLILYALFLFLFVMRKLIVDNILSEPFFWINSGILFYFSGNLLIYAFSNYLIAFRIYDNSALWLIPVCLNIIYNLFFSIGFWKTRTR